MAERHFQDRLPSRPVRVPTKVAAEYLGVSARTLEDWRANEKGPNYVRVGRRVRYEIRELDALIVHGIKR